MAFDETKHPRDRYGKFMDKTTAEQKTRDAVRKFSDTPQEDLAALGVEEKRQIAEDSEPAEDISGLLGEEFKGYKGQAAVDKLMQEKKGHVKGAFHRDDIGDIDLLWGNERLGIQHIILQRQKEKDDEDGKQRHVNDVINHLSDAVENGTFRRKNDRGNFEFIHNGLITVIAPEYHGHKITFVLTGFKRDKKTKRTN